MIKGKQKLTEYKTRILYSFCMKKGYFSLSVINYQLLSTTSVTVKALRLEALTVSSAIKAVLETLGVCKDTRPWPYNHLSTWITPAAWESLVNLAASLKTPRTGSKPTHESQADIHMFIAMILTVSLRRQWKDEHIYLIYK